MITLIHPSKGRPDKALSTYLFWMQMAGDKQNIQHILSIDHSDYTASRYIELFRNQNSLIIQFPNTCVVEATNHAASQAKGDIILYMSDDFKCPLNWDIDLQSIQDSLSESCSSCPFVVKVDDCLVDFKTDVLTIPIMSKALYERLGYFFNPEYKSMFCDQDLFYVAKNNGWLIEKENLKFPHEHWMNKKAIKDNTYLQSEMNYQTGKLIFERRKLLGFPL